MARAQFMEGLLGAPPFSISGKAHSNAQLRQVIGKMMLRIDPETDATTSPWVSMESLGLYRTAWVAASKAVAKMGLEAEDVLLADMVKGIGLAKNGSKTADLTLQNEVGEALAETSHIGSIFYEVGKLLRAKKKMVLSGEVALAEILNKIGMAARREAMDIGRTLMRRRVMEMENIEEIGKETLGDADDINAPEWEQIISQVMGNPAHPAAQEFLSWLVEQAKRMSSPVVVEYFESLARGEDLGWGMDSVIAARVGVNQTHLSNGRKKFIGEISKILTTQGDDRFPEVVNMMSDASFLSDLYRGKIHGRMARLKKAAAEKSLRGRVIRLAHENPALRPHLLPLLKQAGDVIPFPGTWRGTPGSNPNLVELPRSPMSIGETLENTKVRAQMFANTLRVTDLTDAGKRGKRVSQFALYDLDRAKVNQETASIFQNLVEATVGGHATFSTLLQMAKTVANEQDALAPKLEVSALRGVDVAPAGVKALRIQGQFVSIRAEHDDFSVEDTHDQNNLSTCIPAIKGGKKDIPVFYRWVQDNQSQIKSMTFQEVVGAMRGLGIKYHQYCAMD